MTTKIDGRDDDGKHAFIATTTGTGPDTASASIDVFDQAGTSHTVTLDFERQDDGSWNITPSSAQGTPSGVITGLAGALFVDLNRFVSPVMLEWHTSGQIMIFVILGGVGRLWGPVAGAALYIIMEHYLGGFTEFWQFPLGILLLCVVLFAPGGLIGILAGKEKRNV